MHRRSVLWRRPFRAITYLFAAEPAPGAERSESITRMVCAPRSSRSEDSLAERGHGKENNNRPFIYNLYARQIDSREAARQKRVLERDPAGRGRGPGASAMNLWQGAELNWAPHTFVCHPASRVP